MKKLLIALLVVLLLCGLAIGLLYFFWTAENVAVLGKNAMDSKDYSRAIRFYETACELAPNEPEYALALSEAYVASGNYTKAERCLVTALRQSPDTALYIKLSSVYVAQDKLMDAQEMLDNINNSAIASELAAQRPAAPEFSHEGGEYGEYIAVSLSAPNATVYYSTTEEYPSIHKGAYDQPIELGSGDTRIAAVAVAENGLVSPYVYREYLIRGVIEDITFSNPELETYVRDTLYIPRTESVTTEDLWSFTELNIAPEMTDLSDLRYFVNLNSLTIQNSSAEDFSFLAYTPELITLNLAETKISAETLELIGKLSKLEYLNLNACGISNISPLSGCTSLTYLNLSENSISDISPIADATSLRELDLSDNAVSYITALEKMTALETLDISANDVQDISVLKNCAALTSLDISNNRISTLAVMSQLTKLRNLNASYAGINDISALSACTELAVLNLCENEIADISVLSSLEKLTELDASHNSITALPELKKTCALSKINLSYNLLTDISPLAGLVNLHTVNVEYNAELTDITCLTTCYMLMRVDAFGTLVTEVKPLTDMMVSVNYDPSVAINEEAEEP